MRTVKKNNVEELLFKAFADAVPDRTEEIIKKASAKKTPGALMSIDQVNYRKKYLHYAAMAAAVLVLIAGVIISTVIVKNHEVAGTITVEGSACIEITLNRNDRPLSINAHDSFSQAVARNVRKDHSTLSEAVDDVLDAMRDCGCLDENNNTVLITASFSDAARAREQLDIAVGAAKDSFAEAGFDGAVLSTIASKQKEILRLSQRNHVSVGKAEMVSDILTAIPDLNAADLCRLSINDLNLICRYRGVMLTSIAHIGEPHGCITPEQAAQLALDYVSEPDSAAEAVLGCDEIGLIYTVTVSTPRGAVDCRLSAVSGELITDDAPPAAEPTENPSIPTTAPTVPATQPTEPTQPQNTPPTPTTVSPTSPTRPTEAPATAVPTQPMPTQPAPTKPAPTQPVPTQPAPTQPAPTQPAPTEPDIFTRAAYYRYTSGVTDADVLPAAARPITIRRVLNGYDTYYDADSFQYTAQGVQGGVTALVFNAAQFRALTGTNDSRFDDAYFEQHVLYIYMNRDADYHWTKSLTGAYVDGSTLYLENAEAIGRYVGDQDTRIHTVIYELNKDDLRAFTDLLEFE